MHYFYNKKVFLKFAYDFLYDNVTDINNSNHSSKYWQYLYLLLTNIKTKTVEINDVLTNAGYASIKNSLLNNIILDAIEKYHSENKTVKRFKNSTWIITEYNINGQRLLKVTIDNKSRDYDSFSYYRTMVYGHEQLQDATSEEIWIPDNFNVHEFIFPLWKGYNNFVFTNGLIKKLELKQDLIFGSNNKNLITFFEKTNQYKNGGISRTYLFYGPPGTGKSTFAFNLSKNFDQKILKIDPSACEDTNINNIMEVVEMLKPNFVILDDIDRNNSFLNNINQWLDFFAETKQRLTDVTFILTANDITRLDRALLRPGRIDEILEFNEPDAEDRKELIINYALALNVQLQKQDVDTLVEISESLTHAYIKEIVIQTKYNSVEHVIHIIEKMKELNELLR